MKKLINTALVLLALTGMLAPVYASADDEAPKRATKPAREAASSTTVQAQEEEEKEAGLLLPAVQKVRSSAATSESSAPGVEPDEIDAKAAAPGIEHEDIGVREAKPRAGMTGQSRRRGEATTSDASSAPARELDKASPKLAETVAGGRRTSTQQMMLKLRPRTGTLVASGQGGNMTPGDKVAQPGQAPKYEIADCGTATSPMICCHHEAGDGSTCNMFQMLCENAGGTAQGDATDATCSDWP